MKEEFKQDGWKDFAQRYGGTFGWFLTEKNERLLVQLLTVDEEKLCFTAKYGMKYFAHPDKGNVFEFIPVTKGVYQVGEYVMYVCRKPARQWKRGLCYDNTFIYNMAMGDTLHVDFANIEAIYGGNTGVVLEKFKKDMSPMYVALDNIFSIVGNNFMLYNNCIGTFSRAKSSVILSNPMFKQEVQDLFRSLSMEVFVE